MVVVGYAEGGLEFSTDDGSGPAGDQQTAAGMTGAMNGGAFRPSRPPIVQSDLRNTRE